MRRTRSVTRRPGLLNRCSPALSPPSPASRAGRAQEVLGAQGVEGAADVGRGVIEVLGEAEARGGAASGLRDVELWLAHHQAERVVDGAAEEVAEAAGAGLQRGGIGGLGKRAALLARGLVRLA